MPLLIGNSDPDCLLVSHNEVEVGFPLGSTRL
uniref:Uncharacterized protein n=1 Tax=Anguilla anguilla TaxID=7936 RepID=A0A0E9VYJ0_ANGAN